MSEGVPGSGTGEDRERRIDPRLAPSAAHIAAVQRPDGLIPWYPGGPADTWDHVEAAMGLSVAGRHGAARRAYGWLADTQEPDGGWWAAYGDGDGERAETDGQPPRKEPHRTAYVAVGAWLHYRATGDRGFLTDLWPTVRDALDFALAHRSPAGEVYWAVDAGGDHHEDALVSGCASVHVSLACGAAIAGTLGHDAGRWLTARERLGRAIRGRPDRFDRTWEPKPHAMTWFYPVLCGVATGAAARRRLDARAGEFVEEGLGCRCVRDEPWVTVAESCELVAALAAVGRSERAREVFEWQFARTDERGLFPTGYQFADGEVWPDRRPTWTAGAALLADDVLAGGPARDLFVDHRPE